MTTEFFSVDRELLDQTVSVLNGKIVVKEIRLRLRR